MKFRSFYLTAIGLLLFAFHASPSIFYVNVSNTVPVSPFTTWSTAATNIQDAIDAASDGDLILVTNGIYQTGGRVVYGSLTNRVAINNAVTVQSVNGPAKTSIQGNAVLGNNAVRCVYLTNNAALLGFTLTNGATRTTGDNYEERSGGGIWCESSSAVISNCVVVHGAASFWGGGTVSGTLINCTLTNNTAGSCGGGALSGVLTNCVIVRNSAAFGGGVCSNTLFNCSLTNNWATSSGGGAFSCVLSNCFLFRNSAVSGGGAICGTLTGCTLTTNTAYDGGGSCSNTLNSCILLNNVATNNGGGAIYGTLTGCSLTNNTAANGGGSCSNTLNNCTLMSNSATNNGGGAYASALNSCVLHHNSAAFGGGVHSSTAFNCLFDQTNSASSRGGGAYSSTLTNCTLTRCQALNEGCGSYRGTLNRCVITHCQSSNWNLAFLGSGSDADILNNCFVAYNSGAENGGGAAYSVLNNCTVVQNNCNLTGGGGGTYECSVTNSIVYYNTSGSGSMFTYDDGYFDLLDHCCVKITPFLGPGCFTNAPLFLDGLHLQTNSPCIDAGNSNFAAGAVDCDGRPRIVGASVDIGATEFQGANQEPFISWLYKYGLPDDGTADYADSDGTGMNNWQKWIAGLNPTNTASVFALQSPAVSGANNAITWSSVTNRTYYVQRSGDLSQADFSSTQSNIVGQAGTTSFTDTTATNGDLLFYRIGIQ